MTNLYGDVELDARGMRALAHPVRLAILDQLRTSGPNTATGLAPAVGASPSVTSWHLRHLAEHGLVRDADQQTGGRQRWWQATAAGFRHRATDPESRAAAAVLDAALAEVEGDLPGRWRREVEPQLEPDWRGLAGRTNTTVALTFDELAALETRFEELLAPYVRRSAAERPPGARPVRFLRHTLPGLAEAPTTPS